MWISLLRQSSEFVLSDPDAAWLDLEGGSDQLDLDTVHLQSDSTIFSDSPSDFRSDSHITQPSIIPILTGLNVLDVLNILDDLKGLDDLDSMDDTKFL